MSIEGGVRDGFELRQGLLLGGEGGLEIPQGGGGVGQAGVTIALGLEQVASVHGGCVTDISSPRWILAPTEPALKMALILKLKAVHESLPC